jgi:hypothetical protein
MSGEGVPTPVVLDEHTRALTEDLVQSGVQPTADPGIPGAGVVEAAAEAAAVAGAPQEAAPPSRDGRTVRSGGAHAPGLDLWQHAQRGRK